MTHNIDQNHCILCAALSRPFVNTKRIPIQHLSARESSQKLAEYAQSHMIGALSLSIEIIARRMTEKNEDG
jgi:hypothetical protein